MVYLVWTVNGYFLVSWVESEQPFFSRTMANKIQCWQNQCMRTNYFFLFFFFLPKKKVHYVLVNQVWVLNSVKFLERVWWRSPSLGLVIMQIRLCIPLASLKALWGRKFFTTEHSPGDLERRDLKTPPTLPSPSPPKKIQSKQKPKKNPKHKYTKSGLKC